MTEGKSPSTEASEEERQIANLKTKIREQNDRLNDALRAVDVELSTIRSKNSSPTSHSPGGWSPSPVVVAEDEKEKKRLAGVKGELKGRGVKKSGVHDHGYFGDVPVDDKDTKKSL